MRNVSELNTPIFQAKDVVVLMLVDILLVVSHFKVDLLICVVSVNNCVILLT